MASLFSRKKKTSASKEPSADAPSISMPEPVPVPATQGYDVNGFLKQEYMQWEKAHAKMKDSPPADGHDYLKHAANLLALLEGMGAGDTLFTKAVIECFKAAVLFEQDRRENDARVTSVFLAQTDMMRVLLDVDDIANRRRNRPNADVLRSDATLNDILLAIQKEIKSCGNSIDTYYNESRFVKFWKSQDWKERILAHIEQFNKFRVELQQTLSIQVASGVEDLVSKMDIVLSRFFTPKHDWEKALDARTQNIQGNTSDAWAADTLQSLISVTQDASAVGAGQGQAEAFAADMQLFKVKKELGMSLDALCERNVNKFEMKLSFHAQQMELAIANSAQLVIQSLSGPSDRLVNEELKQLWKEMDWIFCVENKFFVSALFEFYLDRFSSNRSISTIPSKEGETTADTERGTIAWFKQLFSLSVSAPKFSFLSRLGAINHPDAWTLEYIALHGEQITKAIDNDDSGFIRISEANAFAQQCPKGWSLPQWCAYSAAGWAYEARIYRRRISYLTSKLTEMQARVLPSNRGYLFMFSFVNFCTICHAFTREPTSEDARTFAPELRELVKEKVLHQDDLYREHLQSLKWTVEDESTIHLLYGEKDPEKYILQFCTLMLEQFLALSSVCRTATVDVREWLRLSAAFRVMREVTVKRVSELNARFQNSKNSAEDIATYHGGIWSYVVHELDYNKINTLSSDMFVPYSRQELAEARADMPLLDDFPATMTLPYLEHPTWEDYARTLDPKDVPEAIPKTWDPIDDTLFTNLADRSLQADFPFSGWGCDRCRNVQTQERRYTCLKCPGLDFCRDCLKLEPNEYVTQHTPLHTYLLVSFIYMPEEQQRISLDAENVLEQLQQQHRAQQRSNGLALASKEKEEPAKGEEEATKEEEVRVSEGPTTLGDDGQKKEDERKEEEVLTPPIGGGESSNSDEKEEEAKPETEQDMTAPSEEDNSDQKQKEIKTEEVVIAPDEDNSDSKEETRREPEHVSPKKDGDIILDNAQTSVAEKSSESTSVIKSFVCGRCIEPISWESDFFRCVGHSCQNHYVCEKCLPEQFEADDDDHQWWHTLLCLRKDLIVNAPSDPPTSEIIDSDVKQNAKATDEVRKDEEPAVVDSAIHARISNIEEKLTILDNIHSCNSALEQKVERLEAKLDTMMAALETLLGNWPRKSEA